mgnify:CR=1 FL=1
MKNKKSIAIILIFITLTMMFFTYKVTITYDTSHYLWLTSLLTPNGDFSTWDVARSIIFPLFIRISNMLFGYNTTGILVGMYIFYIIMIVTCYFIYKDTIKEEKCCSKTMKCILGILFFVLIAINPMIFGYYHTLLTEFFGITLAMLGCYLSWKWMDVDFKENKIKYSVYTLILAVLVAIAWHLKQPYVSTILFPIIISAILSFIRNTSIKNFLQRAITIIICIIVLAGSIKLWNTVLEKNNVQIKADRTSEGFLSSGIIGGITEYSKKNKEEFDTAEKVNNNEKLNQNDKEKMTEILNNNSEDKSFIVIDTKNEKYDVIYAKGETLSTGEAVKYLLSTMAKDPKAIIRSYTTNYLATTSLYNIEFEGMDIIINKKLNFTNTAEISAIGFRMYEPEVDNVFPLSEELEPYATVYKGINTPIKIVNIVMKNLETPVTIVMKISYLILPILTILSIISVFVVKKKYNEKYRKIIDIIVILYTFSILHILVHSVLGAIIDRYTMPVLATTFMAIMLSIYTIVYRKKYKVNNNKELGKENKNE